MYSTTRKGGFSYNLVEIDLLTFFLGLSRAPRPWTGANLDQNRESGVNCWTFLDITSPHLENLLSRVSFKMSFSETRFNLNVFVCI
jgi:hypothetical protein